MLLSSSPVHRSLLETQIRQVYDVTRKPLSEIRMDLEYTGDAQKTIERIYDGEFLKDTPRDPSFKERFNGSAILSQPLSPGASTSEYRGDEGQSRKGKGTAKAVPQKPELIDLCGSSDEALCDSSDEAPSAVQGFRSLSKFQPAKSLLTTTRFDSSLSSIVKPYPDSTVIPKPANPKPYSPGYKTPPLFRYSPLSTSSPSPPPLDPPLNSPKNKHLSPIAPLRLDSSPVAVTPPPNKKQKTTPIIDLDSESEPELRLLTFSHQPAASSAAQNPSKLSATTRALLQELADSSEDSFDDPNNDLGVKKRSGKVVARKKTSIFSEKAAPAKRKAKDVSEETGDYDDGEEERGSITEKLSKKSNRLSEAEKAHREAEKEEARLSKQQERETKIAEKEAAKEAAKVQKRREKEAKEAGKRREQELNSVNKLKISKKDSAPEMIVDVSVDLSGSTFGDQLQGFLLFLGCEVNREWYPVTAGICRAVKWRRKVKAEYSEEMGMFLPLSVEEVRDEQHILVHLTAKEFLDISMNTAHQDGLAQHISRIRRLHPGKNEGIQLIYLIEGLEALSRKNRNNRNRQYRNRVMAQLGTGEGSNSAVNMDIIDDDQIEDARLRLQIVHGCLIHETQSETESAEWIAKFTGDISTIPYKKSRVVADTAFCADVGQVKTGIGKADTYSRMLGEINRVTPSVANGVASRYPDVQALVNAFRLHGENALENLPNIATRDGLPMNRNIGSTTSKRIYGIFMGADSSSTDV